MTSASAVQSTVARRDRAAGHRGPWPRRARVRPVQLDGRDGEVAERVLPRAADPGVQRACSRCSRSGSWPCVAAASPQLRTRRLGMHRAARPARHDLGPACLLCLQPAAARRCVRDHLRDPAPDHRAVGADPRRGGRLAAVERGGGRLHRRARDAAPRRSANRGGQPRCARRRLRRGLRGPPDAQAQRHRDHRQHRVLQQRHGGGADRHRVRPDVRRAERCTISR